MGILEDFGVLGIYFLLLGGFWDSVDRGARRGFRKYLNYAAPACDFHKVFLVWEILIPQGLLPVIFVITVLPVNLADMLMTLEHVPG